MTVMMHHDLCGLIVTWNRVELKPS